MVPMYRAQGMAFSNFSRPGAVDFSVCEFWAKVDALLGNADVTASAAPVVALSFLLAGLALVN